eukprot:SAG31_NODE_2272_length_6038_cov_37.265196_2_plen_381_part_00
MAQACVSGLFNSDEAIDLELHKYQLRHLETSGKSLTAMVEAAKAAADSPVEKSFVCAHCGPTNPLKADGGMDKETKTFKVSGAAAAFLKEAKLPKVAKGAIKDNGEFVEDMKGKRMVHIASRSRKCSHAASVVVLFALDCIHTFASEKPDSMHLHSCHDFGCPLTQVVPNGETKQDANKAARICIDRDIQIMQKQNEDIDLELHKYQLRHLETSGKSLTAMVEAAKAAADSPVEKSFVCAHCGPTNPLKADGGMDKETKTFKVSGAAAAFLKEAKLPKVAKGAIKDNGEFVEDMKGKRMVHIASRSRKCSHAASVVVLFALDCIHTFASEKPDSMHLHSCHDFGCPLTQVVPNGETKQDANKAARICIDRDIQIMQKQKS